MFELRVTFELEEALAVLEGGHVIMMSWRVK